MTEFEPYGTPFGESPFDDDPSVQPVDLPIWRESLALVDWWKLRMSPVYYGCGVPRGHGEPVVLVPGFLAGDASMVELWAWLRRIGYRAILPEIGRNTDCPDFLRRRLTLSLERTCEQLGGPVKVVGHSLGGMLARTVAIDRADLVERVIALGSPITDSVRAHPMVIEATKQLRVRGIGPNLRPSCFSGHCTCRFVENMYRAEHGDLKRFAVYSKNDAVVEWTSCLEDDNALNHEVTCTHNGMVADADAYAVVARLLTCP